MDDFENVKIFTKKEVNVLIIETGRYLIFKAFSFDFFVVMIVIKFILILVSLSLFVSFGKDRTDAKGKYLSYEDYLLDSICYYVNKGISTKEFPGVQMIIVREGKVWLDTCMGKLSYEIDKKVDYNTIYDLASVSKCMGTTLMAMKLYDEGKFSDSCVLSDYIDQYKNTDLGSLPMTRFFTHSSGVVSSLSLQYKLIFADGCDAYTNNWFSGVLHNRKSKSYPTLFSKSRRENLYIYKGVKQNDYLSSKRRDKSEVKLCDSLYLSPDFYENVVDSLLDKSKLRENNRVVYSDVNFYYIRKALENAADTSMDSYLYKNIYSKMLLNNIGYTPLGRGFDMQNIAPTENDKLFRHRQIRGYVHDEFAAIMGGVEGNAGLFSNARDLLPICRELMDSTDGFFKAETKKHFLSQPYFDEKNLRALGFQRQDSTRFLRRTSFGHNGFTGTFFQIDPSQQLILIFLSNTISPSRTHIQDYNKRTYYQIWRLLNDNFIKFDMKENNLIYKRKDSF